SCMRAGGFAPAGAPRSSASAVRPTSTGPALYRFMPQNLCEAGATYNAAAPPSTDYRRTATNGRTLGGVQLLESPHAEEREARRHRARAGDRNREHRAQRRVEVATPDEPNEPLHLLGGRLWRMAERRGRHAHEAREVRRQPPVPAAEDRHQAR